MNISFAPSPASDFCDRPDGLYLRESLVLIRVVIDEIRASDSISALRETLGILKSWAPDGETADLHADALQKVGCFLDDVADQLGEIPQDLGEAVATLFIALDRKVSELEAAATCH